MQKFIRYLLYTVGLLSLLVAAATLLSSCRSSKRMDKLGTTPTQITYSGVGQPIINLPKKVKGSNTFVFAKDSKVETTDTKLKGSTQSTNNQTADNGSTIGGNDQSGSDESKIKESATSEAQTSGTAGQGGKVDGKAEATASNSVGGSSIWWYVLAAGFGFALRQFGPTVWKIVKPV